MEKLWAPWRMRYIMNVDAQSDECIFCSLPQKVDDRENLILYRGENVFVIMNRFPYNNGHLMIVPFLHCNDCSNLDDGCALELWKLTCSSKVILKKLLNPEGFNIGMNLGRVAGAGIDQHIHMHIVPRWNGDTNFMPVLGETKVISQSLEDSYDQLIGAFAQLGQIS